MTETKTAKLVVEVDDSAINRLGGDMDRLAKSSDQLGASTQKSGLSMDRLSRSTFTLSRGTAVSARGLAAAATVTVGATAATAGLAAAAGVLAIGLAAVTGAVASFGTSLQTYMETNKDAKKATEDLRAASVSMQESYVELLLGTKGVSQIMGTANGVMGVFTQRFKDATDETTGLSDGISDLIPVLAQGLAGSLLAVTATALRLRDAWEILQTALGNRRSHEDIQKDINLTRFQLQALEGEILQSQLTAERRGEAWSMTTTQMERQNALMARLGRQEEEMRQYTAARANETEGFLQRTYNMLLAIQRDLGNGVRAPTTAPPEDPKPPRPRQESEVERARRQMIESYASFVVEYGLLGAAFHEEMLNSIDLTGLRNGIVDAERMLNDAINNASDTMQRERLSRTLRETQQELASLVSSVASTVAGLEHVDLDEYLAGFILDPKYRVSMEEFKELVQQVLSAGEINRQNAAFTRALTGRASAIRSSVDTIVQAYATGTIAATERDRLLRSIDLTGSGLSDTDFSTLIETRTSDITAAEGQNRALAAVVDRRAQINARIAQIVEAGASSEAVRNAQRSLLSGLDLSGTDMTPDDVIREAARHQESIRQDAILQAQIEGYMKQEEVAIQFRDEMSRIVGDRIEDTISGMGQLLNAYIMEQENLAEMAAGITHGMIKDTLSAVGNALTLQLTAEAIAAMTSVATIPIGIGKFAAVGAIKGLFSAAGAALTSWGGKGSGGGKEAKRPAERSAPSQEGLGPRETVIINNQFGIVGDMRQAARMVGDQVHGGRSYGYSR